MLKTIEDPLYENDSCAGGRGDRRSDHLLSEITPPQKVRVKVEEESGGRYRTVSDAIFIEN
jgi:hypothetical protein